jgi:hypothetical protein
MKIVNPEIVMRLNEDTHSGNLGDVIEKFDLELVESHNNYITLGHDGIEVWGLDDTSDKVLVYDRDRGWDLKPQDSWVGEIMKYALDGYSFETKLNMIRTITALKNYDPGKLNFSPNLPLKMFWWVGEEGEGYLSIAVLARDISEARMLAKKELQQDVEILMTEPKVFKTPAAAILRSN